MSPRFSSGHDESRWLLKALRETAHELESQLWQLDEGDLRWRPVDEAWSLKEVAAHLRDCEEHFFLSLELICGRDEPRIPAFDGDALVLDRDYREVDLYEALERFAYLRELSLELLWQTEPGRSGSHPYLGRVTIAQLARRQNEHDLEHLWQVRKLVEALGRREAASLG